MIEIPESLTVARQLNETVFGKEIKEVDAGHTKHGFAWYSNDPAEYSSIMTGATVGHCQGIGSMVEMNLGEYCFTIGDGINIRYYEPEEKEPDKYQMKIAFEDNSFLICTVQMYGSMFLFRPECYDNKYYWVGKEKPMPGTSEFSIDYFSKLREEAAPNISIKGFLATEQRIPGLGNGVLQDILLEAGLHPKRKLITLSETDFEKMYHSVVDTLEKMTLAGGRDTEKDLFGNIGGYQTKLSRKMPGNYCPNCGGPVQKISYMGGSVYVCDNCQPLIK